MTDQTIVPATDQKEPTTKQWVTPDLFDLAVAEVTASIYATSGNDGTFGFRNNAS